MTRDIAATVVKKSISLSGVVSEWAEELAAAKGFGTNFSAYIADLIRRDYERQNDLRAAGLNIPLVADSARMKAAADEIVETVQSAARGKKASRRRRMVS